MCSCLDEYTFFASKWRFIFFPVGDSSCKKGLQSCWLWIKSLASLVLQIPCMERWGTSEHQILYFRLMEGRWWSMWEWIWDVWEISKIWTCFLERTRMLSGRWALYCALKKVLEPIETRLSTIHCSACFVLQWSAVLFQYRLLEHSMSCLCLMDDVGRWCQASVRAGSVESVTRLLLTWCARSQSHLTFHQMCSVLAVQCVAWFWVLL